MIHILFMILKALGICTCFTVSRASYRLHRPVSSFLLPGAGSEKEEDLPAQKRAEEYRGFQLSCRADGPYEEQKPEAQILLFGASLETWKRRLKKIRRGEASVPRTEENEDRKCAGSRKTAEQKAPDQKKSSRR